MNIKKKYAIELDMKSAKLVLTMLQDKIQQLEHDSSTQARAEYLQIYQAIEEVLFDVKKH